MTQLINRFGEYDVVVVEATIAGVTAAIRLAHQGNRVAIVTSGTSPLTELTSCLGAMLSSDEMAAIPAELAGCFRADEQSTVGAWAGFPQARIAEAAEDALLDAGVAIFYNAVPGGVIVRPSSPAGPTRVRGVAFGGKFGVAVATATPNFPPNATPRTRVGPAGASGRTSTPPGTAL